MSEIIKIDYYPVNSEKKPFDSWLNELDFHLQDMIDERLARVRLGLFGKREYIKSDDVWELKFWEGGGIRVYYGKAGRFLVIILWGGNKSTQKRDIKKAGEYWKSHKMEITHDNKKRSSYQQEL